MKRKMTLVEMTSEDAKELFNRTKTVIMPFGATEQHGPGMPLGTDNFVAEVLANRIAEKIDVVVAPLLPVGISYFHMDLAGTMTVKIETYSKFVEELTLSLVEHGAKYIVYLNGHVGNKLGLELAAIGVQTATDARVIIVNPCPVTETVFNGELDAGHAGRAEVDFVLAYDPDLIDLEKAASKPGWEEKVKRWPGHGAEDVYKVRKSFIEDQFFGEAQGASVDEAQMVVKRVSDEIIARMEKIFGEAAILKKDDSTSRKRP